MATIQEQAAQFRAQLAAQRQPAVGQLTAAYAGMWQRLQADLAQVEKRIAAARAGGAVVRVSWLVQQAQYRLLVSHLETQLAALAPTLIGGADRLAQAGAAAGVADGAAMQEALGVPLPAPMGDYEVEHIVATTTSGPLRELIERRAPEHSQRVATVLQDAVLRGWAPAKTARALRAANDGELAHSVMIARTEQLRAYREATRRSYQQNPAVEQWMWSARCSDRTCPACWALHGRIFDTATPMATHPNCMCVMLPVVPDINYGPAGQVLFARLPANRQRLILGPAAFAAFRAGALELPQLVREQRSDRWGLTRTTASLASVLGPQRVAQYIAAAR